jgi:hypothetical protein
MRSKRAVLGALVSAGAVMVAAGLAWACTSFSTIGLSSSAGQAGSEVAVTGAGAEAGGPVVIRWNALEGPVLATTTADANGAFTVPVRVPDSLGGVHVVLAVDAAGDVARAAFEVTGVPVPERSASPSGASGVTGLELGRGAALLALGLLGVALVGAGLATAGGRRAVATLP